jgi:hypothetical protein
MLEAAFLNCVLGSGLLQNMCYNKIRKELEAVIHLSDGRRNIDRQRRRRSVMKGGHTNLIRDLMFNLSKRYKINNIITFSSFNGAVSTAGVTVVSGEK